MFEVRDESWHWLFVRGHLPVDTLPIASTGEHLHVPEPDGVVLAETDVAGDYADITADPDDRFPDDVPGQVARVTCERHERIPILMRQRGLPAPPEKILRQHAGQECIPCFPLDRILRTGLRIERQPIQLEQSIRIAHRHHLLTSSV